MKKSLLLGLGIAGVAGYFLWKKNAAAAAAPAPQPGGTPQAPTVAAGTVAYQTPSTQPAGGGKSSGPSTATTILSTTATGASIGSAFGPYGTVIGAAAGAIGGTMLAVFGGSGAGPLEPVSKILITEMPYAYQDRSNIPPGAIASTPDQTSGGIYALDKYGYLWQIGRPLDECGWLPREVIAVNWQVFSMMPKGNALICNRTEIEMMPRPVAADLLRGVFGNDIRFYVGGDPNVHGPWEGANIKPIPGTPAEWAAIAGDYHPTVASTPGDWA